MRIRIRRRLLVLGGVFLLVIAIFAAAFADMFLGLRPNGVLFIGETLAAENLTVTATSRPTPA